MCCFLFAVTHAVSYMELTLERFKTIRSLAGFLFDGYFIVFHPLFLTCVFTMFYDAWLHRMLSAVRLPSVIHTAAPDRGKLVTLVAGSSGGVC